MVAAGNTEIGDLILSNYDIDPGGDRGALAGLALLGAEIHALWPAAHHRHLRPRDGGGLRHQCHAGLHRRPSSSAPCWARWAAR